MIFCSFSDSMHTSNVLVIKLAMCHSQLHNIRIMGGIMNFLLTLGGRDHMVCLSSTHVILIDLE